MAISYTSLSSSSKTRYVTSLLSGTSWTVPTGVTSVNVKRTGGGGGGGGGGSAGGAGGATTFGTLASATGGNSGSKGEVPNSGSPSAGVNANANSGLGGSSDVNQWSAGSNNGYTGGWGTNGVIFEDYLATTPGASITYAIGAGGTAGTAGTGNVGGAGGSGKIEIEYWV